MLFMSRQTGFFFGLIFITLSSFAQDNHYEYLPMGSKNSLIPNSGLARFEDQSAVIFNPATLSYAQGSSFAFNTTAIGLSNIRFDNGLGQGFNIRYGNFTLLPTVAAGVLKPKKDEKDWVLGYGIYHRMQEKLRFIDRNQTTLDVINNVESPGSEVYIAQYNLGHELDEVGVILGIGWNINERLAIGFSQSFTHRQEEYSQSFTSSVIPLKGTGASVDVVSLISDFYTQYYKIFGQTKIGLAANYDKWDIGVTLGLPSFGIMGKGEVMSQAQLSNIRLDDDLSKPRKSFFANGRAEKLKSTYKYGMTAALGISKPFGHVRLYGGVNWYAGVKNYSILDPGNVEFLQPSTDSNVLYTPNALRVYAQNKTVVNGSLGLDWNYKDNKHLFFSLHSDGHFATQNSEEPGRTLPIKTWDNYHIALGTQQTFFSSDWMIGLRYSFATLKNALQPYSFDNPTEDNFLRGERERGSLKATAIQLILSYSFRFGQKQ
jgi:hypothetical protein